IFAFGISPRPLRKACARSAVATTSHSGFLGVASRYTCVQGVGDNVGGSEYRQRRRRKWTAATMSAARDDKEETVYFKPR
ncbi:hypothetical protein, partial [Streptococcus anginosus]|uniref:hypothetical protein n=1 Tax=Streptococcus anginosus TaxID=1328 RepID=UPI002ED9F049